MRRLVQHPVHLVHVALGIVVLHAQLIAVGLADGAVFIRPLVPDVGTQVPDVVGLLLPDPQQFVHGGFPIGPAQGQDGKLLLQIVAVDDAEFLYGVGGRSILPAGTDFQLRVPYAVGQDLPAVFYKNLISAAHSNPPVVM